MKNNSYPITGKGADVLKAIYKKLLSFVSLACVFCLCMALAPTPVQARSAEDVQAEIEAKKQQLDQLENTINDGKSDKATAQAAIAEYQQEYDNLLGLIDEQDSLINSTEDQLDTKGDELSKTNEKLQENREQFEKRLVAIYKSNDKSVLSAILSVDSFSELIRLVDALQRISKNDTALLDTLVTERENYEKQRTDLEGTIDDLTVKMEELQANRDWAAAKVQEMQILSDAADAQIQEGEQQRQYTAEEVAQLQAEAAAIFAQAEALSSSKGDGSERQTAGGSGGSSNENQGGGENSGGNSGGDNSGGNSGENSGGTDPAPPTNPNPGGGIKGSLAWPVPGRSYISSYFGDPRANTGYHYGIDIPAPQGTSIVASAPGTVKVAEYHSSYGNYIIIDHGDGLRTLYAHCVQLYVSAGQPVTTGQSIAGVGNTGDSYSAHLHYEVHDGGRQNPLNYLP